MFDEDVKPAVPDPASINQSQPRTPHSPPASQRIQPAHSTPTSTMEHRNGDALLHAKQETPPGYAGLDVGVVGKLKNLSLVSSAPSHI